MQRPPDTPPFLATGAALRAALGDPGGVACHCGLRRCQVWDSVSEADWPAAQMRCIATLRDPALDEPTFEEYHPDGTRYDSSSAPVAPAYFPANRAQVYRCGPCGQHWLRYTEYGGYYIDHRVRRLESALIVDAQPPQSPAATPKA